MCSRCGRCDDGLGSSHDCGPVVAVVMVIVIVGVVVVIAIGGERLIVSVCCGGYGRFGCGGGIDGDGPDNGRSSGFGDQGDWPWWS